jgi:hypothetical protein
LVGRLSRSAPPGVSITLNGGIQGLGAVFGALETWPSLTGVQAGRWLLRRPLDILAIDDAFGSAVNC